MRSLGQIKVKRVRKANPELLKALFAVELSAHVSPWTYDDIAWCFESGVIVSVLYEGRSIIGYAMVRTAADEAEILTIGIVRSRQGLGLGKKLLAHGLNAAMEQGAAVCFLEVRVHNSPAIRLYERFGFAKAGVRRNYYGAQPNHPAEDAYTMRCELKDAAAQIAAFLT